jgi:hypothetical protein
MGLSGMRFSNQSKDEVLRHLANMLREGTLYNLSCDPLRIYFEMRESQKQPNVESEKRQGVRMEYAHMSQRMRRLSGTRKRVRPKIRSQKKGRTVNLKGVTY